MRPFKRKEKELSFADLQRMYEDSYEFSNKMRTTIEALVKMTKIVCEQLKEAKKR